jgi:hypothetical protein
MRSAASEQYRRNRRKRERALIEQAQARHALSAAQAGTCFKPGQSGNPHGRQRLTIAPEQLPVIVKLAAKGVRELDIARAVGVSHQVWARQRVLQPEVADALDAGKQQMHDRLVGKLYAQAMDGNIVALLFLLKTRFGYREGEAQDARPQVIINLPTAAPLEQYAPALVAEHAVESDDVTA